MIFLCGMMGSGKTTIGKELAERLKRNFIDTDDIIVQQERMSVNEIFFKKSEKYFRDIELDVIRNLKPGNNVIALGGGAICSMERLTLIKNKGHLIYLEVPLPVLAERLLHGKDRPLIIKANHNRHELQELLADILRRRERYYKKADIIVNAAQSKDHIITEIFGYFNASDTHETW